MLRALRRNQASYWRTLLPPIPASITPGSSPWLRKQNCLSLSAASYEVFYNDSITHVEFAGATRGQFLMARGVRQGCPASGFLFAMAFDPIFRWFQETVIPRNPCNLDLLQPAQCAYADDLAVAALSLGGLMTALGTGVSFRGSPCWPPFELSQNAVGFNTALKSVNPFGAGSLRIVGSFVRSKWSGLPSMLGPWSVQMVTFKNNASTKSLVERLCDFKIYAISVLSFIGSVCAPDKATIKAENHALECTTAGPYTAIPSNLLGVGSVCGLGPDLVGIHSISLAARYRVAACSTTRRQGLEKIQTARGHNCAPIFSLSLLTGRKNFLVHLRCPVSTANAFDIVCRLDRDGKLDEAPQNKKQKVCHWITPWQTVRAGFCWTFLRTSL